MQIDRLIASDFVVKNDKIFFVPLNYPYFIEYDLSKLQIIKKEKIPKVSANTKSFFEQLVYTQDAIIASPCWADYVLKYHLKSKEISKIDILHRDIKDEICGGYGASAYIDNGNVIAFKHFICGDGADAYNVLEIDSKEDSAATKRMKCLKMPKCDKYKTIFFYNCVVYDKYIFLANEMAMYKYSIETNKIEKYSLPFINNKNLGIFKVNDNNMMVVQDAQISIINFLDEKSIITIPFPEGEMGEVIDSKAIFPEKIKYIESYKNIIYLFGANANFVFEIDLNNKEIRRSWMDEKLCGGKLEKNQHDYCFGQFSKPHIYKSQLYVWNIYKQKFYIVKLDEHTIEDLEINIIFSEEESISELKSLLKDGIVRESDSVCNRLETFIQTIKKEHI